MQQLKTTNYAEFSYSFLPAFTVTHRFSRFMDNSLMPNLKPFFLNTLWTENIISLWERGKRIQNLLHQSGLVLFRIEKYSLVFPSLLEYLELPVFLSEVRLFPILFWKQGTQNRVQSKSYQCLLEVKSYFLCFPFRYQRVFFSVFSPEMQCIQQISSLCASHSPFFGI